MLHQNPKLDLFGILRLPPSDFVFPIAAVENVVGQMLEILKKWEADGKIKLAPEMKLPTIEVIWDGVKNLGIYHTVVPLKFTRAGDIVSSSFRTLFYYHNRLENYGLDKMIRWEKQEIEVLETVDG